jgi:hypothetical protein
LRISHKTLSDQVADIPQNIKCSSCGKTGKKKKIECYLKAKKTNEGKITTVLPLQKFLYTVEKFC